MNKAALSHGRHPVAYSQELQRNPPSAILLDEPLLWRDSQARAHAFRDLCIAKQKATHPERTSRYLLLLPFTIVLRLGWGMDPGLVYFFASQPMDNGCCKGYCVVSKDHDLGQEDQVIEDFESVIFDQDRRIVEPQRPAQVPFDLSAELHLRFDAVSVAYRL